jgi:predicted transcriptional regulator
MRKTAEPYELSKTELEIIAELTQSPGSLTDLARRVGRSLPVVVGSINRLAARGFIDEEREGKRRIVRISERKHAQLLRELFLRFPHVPWNDLLSFSGIIPLVNLEWGNVQASRSTEWRALRNMMSHGILQKQAGKVKINPRFEAAQNFVLELQTYNNQRLAREASPRAIIVWNTGPKFIIRVPNDETVTAPLFQATATTKMAEYDIPLISNVKFYFYSPEPHRITAEETLLHTLLTDGVTNTTYALILLAKGPIDRRRLLAKAEEYGLVAQVGEMIRYLDDRQALGLSIKLPPWSEFAEKAADYGVSE